MKYIELVKDVFDNTHYDNAKPENAPYVAYSVQENKLLFTDFIKLLLINTVKKVAYNAAEYTPEYVDLGLPSGIKWATCNIGAKTPEENGMYFSWGDIEGFKFVGQENWDIEEVARLYLLYIEGIEPENITPEAIQTAIAELGDNAQQTVDTLLAENGINALIKDYNFYWDNYKFSSDTNGDNFTKYSSEDGLETLTADDDAAVQLLGNGWRMPTQTEWQELYDNTTRTWIDTSGNEYTGNDVNSNSIPDGQLKGLKLTSNKEGYTANSIFLPASGVCYESLYSDVGIYGAYWSSSLNSSRYSSTYYMYFITDGSVSPSFANSRCSGFLIRPVFSGNETETN